MFTINAESNPNGTVERPAFSQFAVSLADLVKQSQSSGQMMDAGVSLANNRRKIIFMFCKQVLTNI